MTTAHLLDDYLRECEELAFDWRTWNCATFAGRWVQRACGIDPLDGLPHLSRQTDVLRALQPWGGSLLTAVRMRIGLPEVDITLARTGDVAMIEPRTLGIVSGRHIALLHPVRGLAYTPAVAPGRAWRVLP